MDLRRINLANANLHHIGDFSKSNLSHANFLNAALNYTNFERANLSNAYFKGATLVRASFRGANLTGTDLTGTDLTGAILDGAKGITCEQIKSAMIDENTRLPDYISLAGTSGSAYKCENTLDKN